MSGTENLSDLEDEVNTVIEGTFQDEWYELHYKISPICIPKDVTVLDEGQYRFKYRLYGRTEDFKNVQELIVDKKDGIELKLEGTIGFCVGVVLPYMGGIPGVLDRPRTVCTRDGRIFVEEYMLKNSAYCVALPEIVMAAGELFRKKDLLSEIFGNYYKLLSNSVNRND